MAGQLTPEGVWVTLNASPRVEASGALMLDRDGVLVEEVGFLRRRSDVRLAKGAAELISFAHARGYYTGVISNQSGIARGIITWAEYVDVEQEIERQLSQFGAGLDFVLATPFHPEHTPGYGLEHARWRKPGGAMLVHAASQLNLDLRRSWIVGDRESDLLAGRNAGARGGVHVLAGYGKDHRERAADLATENFEVLLAADLIEAKAVLCDRL